MMVVMMDGNDACDDHEYSMIMDDNWIIDDDGNDDDNNDNKPQYNHLDHLSDECRA